MAKSMRTKKLQIVGAGSACNLNGSIATLLRGYGAIMDRIDVGGAGGNHILGNTEDGVVRFQM